MIWFEVVEGKHSNDYDSAGDFKTLSKAMACAKKSKWPYVRVDKFDGDEMFDGDYVDTVYEKKVSA